MNEVGFRNWLSESGVTGKVQSDCVSRLKRIERELHPCDIDEQYSNDRCQHLMTVFAGMGNNDEMKKYPNATFPIGKYYMNTYRHAIKQYVQFLESEQGSK